MKHCSEHYRIINKVKYTQWSDNPSISIKDHKIESPDYSFIRRGDRVFRSLTKTN